MKRIRVVVSAPCWERIGAAGAATLRSETRKEHGQWPILMGSVAATFRGGSFSNALGWRRPSAAASKAAWACRRSAGPTKATRADRLWPAAAGQAAASDGRRVVPAVAAAGHAAASQREEAAAQSARPGRQGRPGQHPLDDQRRQARPISRLDDRSGRRDDPVAAWTADKLGINYRAVEVDFAHFSFDPRELPALLLAGHNKFELTDEVRAEAGPLRDGRRHDPRRRLLRLERFRRLVPPRDRVRFFPAGRCARCCPRSRSTRRTTSSAT